MLLSPRITLGLLHCAKSLQQGSVSPPSVRRDLASWRHQGSSAPVHAGNYEVIASFAGSTDYTSAQSSTTFFTIAHATPTVAVSDNGGTYNGSAFPATATVTDVSGVAGSSLENVTPTLDYIQLNSDGTTTDLGASAPLSAGNYEVIASFAGSSDYSKASSSTVTFTIAQATPTVSVSDAGGTYNGSAFPATATVTGVSGTATSSLENVTPTLDYIQLNSDGTTTDLGANAPIHAGNYEVIATFAGSADYTNASSSTVTFTIRKATPTVSVSDAGGTYNGQRFPAVVTLAGVNGQPASGLEGVPLTLTYYTSSGTPLAAAPSNAGTYTVVAAFAGSSDYSNASAQTTFTINAAAAVVQFTSVTVVPNLLALAQTETFTVHVSSSGGVVHQGTVAFSVDGHSVSAAVDGNGDATASLTLPLLTAASLQSIDAVFSGPNHPPATATQTAFWGLMDALMPAVATFAADGGQSVQSYLLDLPLLDFLYSSSGRLTEVVFGPDWLSLDFRSVNGLTIVTLDGLLPVAVFA